MIKEEQLYELKIEDEEIDGVFAVSFVESPAIERDFVFFSKELTFAAVNDEKKLVAGPLLVPNKKILRISEDGKKYYVYFTKEGIEKIARKFMKDGYGASVTLEHGNKTSGIYLTESWLVEESKKDKSNIYGYTLPAGSWFGVYSVADNPQVWEKVKDGTFKGFSVEALLEHVESNIKLALEKDIEDLTEEEAEVFLSQLKAIIRKDKRYKAKQRIEMESYSDYPDAVRNAARRALDWADKNGWGSCGTPVGKQRANQLAKGEPVSVDTIRRMHSFIARHEGSLEVSKSYSDGCAKLMIDAWGGLAGGRWAKSKLRELGLLEETEAVNPSIPNSTYPGEVAKKKKKDDK